MPHTFALPTTGCRSRVTAPVALSGAMLVAASICGASTTAASTTGVKPCAIVQGGVNGDRGGGNRYTILLVKDPCGNSVQAALYNNCAFPNSEFGGDSATYSGWNYGNTVTHGGQTSTVSGGFWCPTSSYWGYRENLGGKWVYHNLGKNIDPPPPPQRP
jgi:hypothetical protein